MFLFLETCSTILMHFSSYAKKMNYFKTAYTLLAVTVYGYTYVYKFTSDIALQIVVF